MKVNKLLTGTTLAVGLLISAAPVFAASHSSEVIAHPTAQYINCPSDLPSSFKSSKSSSTKSQKKWLDRQAFFVKMCVESNFWRFYHVDQTL
jgi:hypothetical protein